MSKCNRVKNPCKICLAPVSKRNGIQCQGACKTWVHFSCLNYTPGKIKDIKAGIIKVACPCPDCKSVMPKEYRTDEPFSCNNKQCPANRPPKCENRMCPLNRGPVPIKLNKCGAECKDFGTPAPSQPCTPAPRTPPRLPQPRMPQPRMEACSPEPCAPPSYPSQPCGQPTPMPCGSTPETPSLSPTSYDPSPSASHICFDQNKCESGCSSPDMTSGDYRYYSATGAPVPSFHVVEQMCNTVGQLTNQINDLMTKMRAVVGDRGSGAAGNCPHSKNCPKSCEKTKGAKPCYCPGNPAKNKKRFEDRVS